MGHLVQYGSFEEGGGENCVCVSDQVWLTKSFLCEITVVALTHKVAHAKSSVKNTGTATNQ